MVARLAQGGARDPGVAEQVVLAHGAHGLGARGVGAIAAPADEVEAWAAAPLSKRLTCDTVPQLAHMRELLKLMDRDTLELRHARERIERRDDRQPATAQPLHRTFGAGQFTMR